MRKPPSGTGSWTCERGREMECARRSDSGLARHTDLTSQLLRELLGNRQAQTCSFVTPRHTTFRLAELLKNVRHGIRWDTDTRITHRHLDAIFTARGCDVYPASLREF